MIFLQLHTQIIFEQFCHSDVVPEAARLNNRIISTAVSMRYRQNVLDHVIGHPEFPFQCSVIRYYRKTTYSKRKNRFPTAKI